jgi:predicted HTH domain antitoxin
MEEESITLGPAERRRLDVINLLGAGRVTNDEAAELLGLSVRQVQRLHSAFRRRPAG